MKNSLGADGDPVDVFLGPALEWNTVWIVNQINPETKKFDEHKCMIGFRSEEEAKEAYLANYERGWKGLGSIKGMSVSKFKEWLQSEGTKKRASRETEPNEWVEVDSGEYKSALRANPHSTSLMDPEEVTPGYRCFRLDKEGESTNIYYSISPEGEICGLVNNGPHKGLAVPSSLNHALAHGGSWLNCWDVDSKLPNLYARYGFRVTNIEPYDQETYGEPSEGLKASWRLSGWKEGEPYPGVVYMTHQGSKLGSLTKRELPGDSEFSPRSIIVQAKLASVSELTEYDCDLIRDWFYGVFMLLAAPPNLKKALKKFDLNYPEMVLHRTCWLKEQDIEKVVGAMAEGTSVRVRTSRPDTRFQSWSGSLEKARRFGKGIGSQGSPPAGWDRFLVSAHIPGSSILAGAEDMKEHLNSAITRLSLTPHLEEALQDLYRTLDYYTGRQHDQDEYIIHLVDAPVFSAEPIAPDPKIMRQDLSRNAKKVKAKSASVSDLTKTETRLRSDGVKKKAATTSKINLTWEDCEVLENWFIGVYMEQEVAPRFLKTVLKKFKFQYPTTLLHRACWLKDADIKKVEKALSEGTEVRVKTSRASTTFQSWSGEFGLAKEFGLGFGSQISLKQGWGQVVVSAPIPGNSILIHITDLMQSLKLILTDEYIPLIADLSQVLSPYGPGGVYFQDEFIVDLKTTSVQGLKRLKSKGSKQASGIPSFQLRTPTERSLPYSQSITGIHYSNTEGLTHLSTRMYGQGSAGSEKRRIQNDLTLKYRTYFYESQDGGVVDGEALVTMRAKYPYITKLNNLYDLGSDPLEFRKEANDASHLEKLIIGEGFDGYISPSGIPGMPEARPLVIIGDCEIPVKALSHEKVSTQISDALPKRSSQELRLTDEDCEVLHKWVNGYFMSGPSTKMNERLEKVFEKLPFQYTSKRLHRALWVDKDTLLKLQQARKEGVGVNLCTSAKAGQQFQSWSGSIMASLRFSQQVGKEGRGKYWVVVTAQIPGDKVKLRTKDLNSYIQGLKDPSSGESLLSQALYQYTSEDEYIVQLGSESLEIETYMWASKKTPPKQASSDDSFGLYEDEYWIEPSGQLHKAEFGHEAFASDYLKDEILLDHPTYTLFDRGWARCEIGELSAELEGRKLNQAQFNQFQILVNQSVTPEYRENFKVWIEEGTWYVQWDVSDFLKLKNINAVMRGRTKIEQRE
jgi:hypothetical protein